MADQQIVDFTLSDGLTPQQIDKLNYNFRLLATHSSAQDQMGVEINTNAYNAAISAGNAKQAADNAQQYAQEAGMLMNRVKSYADQSSQSYDQVITNLLNSYQSSEEAKDSASKADKAARAAQSSLSNIQDVVGTLNWIANHGGFELATETSPQPNTYYYSREENPAGSNNYTYTSVGNLSENANPSQLGLYKWNGNLDSTVQEYLASHLSLDQQGLWLTNDGTPCSLFLASDGLYFRTPNNVDVAYIKIDPQTQESTFYIAKAIVTKNLKFGSKADGTPQWEWRTRGEGNLSLKWVG